MAGSREQKWRDASQAFYRLSLVYSALQAPTCAGSSVICFNEVERHVTESTAKKLPSMFRQQSLEGTRNILHVWSIVLYFTVLVFLKVNSGYNYVLYMCK
jgi:hypothetical protein